MNEDYPELLDDLRALAAEAPRQAPPRIEQRLKWEFRRQRRLRKLTVWLPGLSVAAAAMIALFVWVHRANIASSPVPAKAAVQASAEEEPDAGFYPLPEAEGLPAVENAMVVRVELPVSSLQLMGIPISQEGKDSSVQAELLLGQDGLARGVRLVQ